MVKLDMLKTAEGFANLKELTRVFGVGRVTISRWVRDGKLPPPKRLAGLIGWDMDELRVALGVKKEAKNEASSQ